MSAGLAHEVKNPMVGICGFSELGAHVDTLEEAHEYFALINADAQRANEILQNLLAFARPEQVALSSLDVNETVHGAVQLFAHQVQLGGVKLVTSYADGLPLIMGSANQLRQVLINLAMNGAHAMSGTQEKVLTVSTQLAPEGWVQILVKDTGHGMSEETQRKLFRPFFTTKPKGQGTGLGLSVSKTIIQQHRGEISVKSMLGQGTTFTVVLPPAPPTARSKPAGWPRRPEADRQLDSRFGWKSIPRLEVMPTSWNALPRAASFSAWSGSWRKRVRAASSTPRRLSMNLEVRDRYWVSAR
jgi:signal transduction histidine kinase